MTKKARQIAAAILALLATSTAFTDIETEQLCVEPDHFLSYILSSLTPIPTALFTLADQFATLTDATAIGGDTLRLLNPATKFHNGNITRPVRPNTHYIAFGVDISDEDTPVVIPTQTLLVFNQFGNLDIAIPGDLVLDADDNPILQLLVPTVKGACPSGNCTLEDSLVCVGDDCFPDGDHYLCYQIDLPQICPLTARFKDQFQDNRIVEDLTPIRLCNPVDKTLNGVTQFADRTETNHLVCYDISDRNVATRLVNLLNQFGQQRGVVRINTELCVPSTKVVTTPPVAG